MVEMCVAIGIIVIYVGIGIGIGAIIATIIIALSGGGR